MSCPRKVMASAIAALALVFTGPKLLSAQESKSPPASATPGQPPDAGQPPPAAQSPGTQPPAAQPAPGADVFGQEITLTPKTVLMFKGSGNWDSAFDTIVDAFKTVYGFLDKQGIKPAGPPMTIYTATDDTGFQFQAAVPIAETPKNPPQGDLTVGESPTGRALKFVHHGSYDSMDSTYEAITNYLDEKNLDARDLFVEQYVTDPLTTPEDKLVIEVYVPLK
ncbi:MAG TPA: GyrI-like domain-containing protein [Xanthobacteraceae bacterium]|nr:GyrI-like domain-containing protein [Xanthobacteraceae bacterium]